MSIFDEDGMISAANCPKEMTITDPFHRGFLESLPKESLVEIITRMIQEHRKLQEEIEGLREMRKQVVELRELLDKS